MRTKIFVLMSVHDVHRVTVFRDEAEEWYNRSEDNWYHETTVEIPVEIRVQGDY